MSASLSGLCTINNLPLSLSNILDVEITSSKLHIISCLAIESLSDGFNIPELFSLYGGLTVTTSAFSKVFKNFESFKSLFINSILETSLSSTLLFAISTISS